MIYLIYLVYCYSSFSLLTLILTHVKSTVLEIDKLEKKKKKGKTSVFLPLLNFSLPQDLNTNGIRSSPFSRSPTLTPYGGPMWLFRVFSSALFLAITVSSIPLAFDVGGKTCGLAFSLSLAAFYFLVSLLKVTTPERSWFRSSIIAVLRFIQWAVILVLLIWSLNRFSVDLDSTGPGWVERTFSGKRAEDSSIQEWLFGREGLVETVALGNWDRLLRWSTPVFQLAEGFCSLLVIQAAGQITRWLVNRGGRSDSWMVCF